jgi:hypothetical protein
MGIASLHPSYAFSLTAEFCKYGFDLLIASEAAFRRVAQATIDAGRFRLRAPAADQPLLEMICAGIVRRSGVSFP